MEYEWGQNKAESNLNNHGVQFEAATEFEWDTAQETQDTRKDYLELRIIAVGFIGNRIHILTYTMRGDLVRIISLRKANARETKAFEERYNET